MGAIAIRAVTKRYRDGTLAVSNFDLEIADGELMILVGPSGCGKTTLLRMIAGLEEITEGEIEIGGRVVNDLTPKVRDIAMVFQNYALYPHMTVAKNMGFSLRRAKVPAAEIRRKVQDTAALLGITEQLDRKPANLSGGQRQRCRRSPSRGAISMWSSESGPRTSRMQRSLAIARAGSRSRR